MNYVDINTEEGIEISLVANANFFLPFSHTTATNLVIMSSIFKQKINTSTNWRAMYFMKFLRQSLKLG